MFSRRKLASQELFIFSYLAIFFSGFILVKGITNTVLEEEIFSGDKEQSLREFYAAHVRSPVNKDVQMQYDLLQEYLLWKPVNAIGELRTSMQQMQMQMKLIRALVIRNEVSLSSLRNDATRIFASRLFTRRLMSQEKYSSVNSVNVQQQKAITQRTSVATYRDEPMFHMDYSGPKTHPPRNN
eukprot:c43393_g1_i1 orf=429-977(-)